MEATPHFTNRHNYFGSMLVRHRCIEKMHGLVPDFSSSVAKSAVTPLCQSYCIHWIFRNKERTFVLPMVCVQLFFGCKLHILVYSCEKNQQKGKKSWISNSCYVFHSVYRCVVYTHVHEQFSQVCIVYFPINRIHIV